MIGKWDSTRFSQILAVVAIIICLLALAHAIAWSMPLEILCILLIALAVVL